MNNTWVGTGIWEGWRMIEVTGLIVLIDPDGNSHGPSDIRKKVYQADLAKRLGVTASAITGRITRKTIPEFDGVDDKGRGYWFPSSLKSVK